MFLSSSYALCAEPNIVKKGRVATPLPLVTTYTRTVTLGHCETPAG